MEDKSFDDDDDDVRQNHKIYMIHSRGLGVSDVAWTVLCCSWFLSISPTGQQCLYNKHTTTLMQWSLTQWSTDSMCTMHIVHSVHLYNALMHCCLIADPLCASPPLTSGGDEKLVLLPPQTLRPHLINPETRDDRICVEHFLVRFLRQTLSCNES